MASRQEQAGSRSLNERGGAARREATRARQRIDETMMNEQAAVACKPRQQDGVLNLWKPAGMTSNAALLKVRRLTGRRKAGHVGILDTHAAGLLPICFGKATRIVQYLQLAPKTYHGVMELGRSTDTQDAQGRVLAERPVPFFTDEEIEAVVARYRGEILQQPPMYSALKHQGRRLYRLARQGIIVDRPLRKVTIHAFELRRVDGTHLSFAVTCSTGTYVRTLCHDLGEELACGAHLKELRRVVLGPFRETDAISLEEVQELARLGEVERAMVSIDTALSFLPPCRVSERGEAQLRHGQSVAGDQLVSLPAAGFEKGAMLRLRDGEGRLLAIGEGLLSSAQLKGALLGAAAVRPKRVLVDDVPVGASDEA
ncbi:MAG: tRNA pseudouridine(55) synthase TruB [Candidatus Tectomicrobia bacterium]|nr:tRNA pseudouridine(55) synthase TruB [Candidatus Tectomicrobia bacterium]